MKIIFLFPILCWSVDVVMPSTEKDLPTIEYAIASLRKNLMDIGRVIVVSKTKITDQAEWVSEESFPFTLQDVRRELNALGIRNNRRDGWYFQQLLKLYAPLVIEGIDKDVLIFDSDTVLLHPMQFVQGDQVLFNIEIVKRGERLYYPSFFEHMTRMHPSLAPKNETLTAVTHHILLQRAPLLELFELVEGYHKIPFWQVFLKVVDTRYWVLGASEYELYFHFMYNYHPEVCEIRIPKRIDVPDEKELERLDYYRRQGYDFLSSHSTERVRHKKPKRYRDGY